MNVTSLPLPLINPPAVCGRIPEFAAFTPSVDAMIVEGTQPAG
jgi:hypothetical protein